MAGKGPEDVPGTMGFANSCQNLLHPSYRALSSINPC